MATRARTATYEEAFSFLREQGIVLVSAKGPVPRLVEVIAGEPIKGSWWSHPSGRAIFAVLGRVTDSPEVLTCRLVDDKVTLVHRRLWPALVKLSARFQPAQLAQVHDEHTAAGHHVTHTTAFPKWVPPEVLQEAEGMTEAAASDALGALLEKITSTPAGKRTRAVKKTTSAKRPAAAKRPAVAKRPSARTKPARR